MLDEDPPERVEDGGVGRRQHVDSLRVFACLGIPDFVQHPGHVVQEHGVVRFVLERGLVLPNGLGILFPGQRLLRDKSAQRDIPRAVLEPLVGHCRGFGRFARVP